jgi:hypothetical protein
MMLSKIGSPYRNVVHSLHNTHKENTQIYSICMHTYKNLLSTVNEYEVKQFVSLLRDIYSVDVEAPTFSRKSAVTMNLYLQ